MVVSNGNRAIVNAADYRSLTNEKRGAALPRQAQHLPRAARSWWARWRG